jgi:hypothetical protein
LSIRTIWVLTAALSALLLAGGCGDSDDSATGSAGEEITVETSSLSKAEFIKQADAICQKTKSDFENAVVASLTRQRTNPVKPTEASPEEKLVETTLVNTYQKQIDEISELGAPSGDEEDIAAFLNTLQQVIDSAGEDPIAFIENDVSFGKAPKLAIAYGLTGCAET